MHPRKYLSYSQMILIEQNPKGYVRKYIYEEEQRTTRAMAYGSLLAESLENDEMTGDIIIDVMAMRLPKFELMDVPELATIPGKPKVPILIKPDTMKADLSAFKEYKTGTTPWSQEMADKSGQITFYAMGMFLKTNKIPQDIELIHLLTEKKDGVPVLTGEMHTYTTYRTMRDILAMMQRAKDAWVKIGEVCAKEII